MSGDDGDDHDDNNEDGGHGHEDAGYTSQHHNY